VVKRYATLIGLSANPTEHANDRAACNPAIFAGAIPPAGRIYVDRFGSHDDLQNHLPNRFSLA